MQLYIAGGCGDQGRNCFYIEGDRHAFIVDAGTSTDGLDRLPDLSSEMIHRAEYLFVTHSHKDTQARSNIWKTMASPAPS